MAAMGIPSETEGQLSVSYGPLLDPFFELGLTYEDADAWRLFGSPEGQISFASQSDAMEAWHDLFATQIWLRDTLARGPMRLERGQWALSDQIAHYMLIESVIDELYKTHRDYTVIAGVITDWFYSEAGQRGWYSSPIAPMRKDVHDNLGPIIMDPAVLSDRMSCLSCKWVSRHHLAWRASRAAVHEQGSTYAPAMLVNPKQGRAWLNPTVMAIVWGRVMAYALGMPRIPWSVIISHRTRPGMLRMLSGWVARAGWRSPSSNSTKIPLVDLPAWYGYGPGQPIRSLRRRIQDDIGRIRLAFAEPLRVPALTSSGLVFPGLQGITLDPRRRPDD